MIKGQIVKARYLNCDFQHSSNLYYKYNVDWKPHKIKGAYYVYL